MNYEDKDYQNVRPLKGRVFARVLERETKVTPESPIIIPTTCHGRPNRAEVVAAHPDDLVKVGDRICYDAYQIRVVVAHGQLANAMGSPIANPGDLFAINETDIYFIEELDDDRA